MVVVAKLMTGVVVVEFAEMPAALSWSVREPVVTASLRAVVIDVYTVSVDDTRGVVVDDTVYDTLIPVDVLSSLSFSRLLRLALALAPKPSSRRRLVVSSLTPVTTTLFSTRIIAPSSSALIALEMAVLKANSV